MVDAVVTETKIELVDDTQVLNEDFKKNVAIPYFKDIYKDLVQQSDNKTRGINKLSILTVSLLARFSCRWNILTTRVLFQRCLFKIFRICLIHNPNFSKIMRETCKHRLKHLSKFNSQIIFSRTKIDMGIFKLFFANYALYLFHQLVNLLSLIFSTLNSPELLVSAFSQYWT
jgi:hypothetical protein